MDEPVEKLRILILEDEPSDAELAKDELEDAQQAFTMLRVDTREAFVRALDEFKPDIVLADYKLPAYSGRDALEYARRTHQQIPVIMVTGAMGDEAAVELLKLGAKDYVLKDRLARLVPAIRRALSEEMGVRNRKLAEGKYKSLFNEAMDGIVLVDCDTWQVVDCNPEFEKQTGRTLEQLKEMKAWEILLPEQQELARQTLLEIEQTGTGRGSSFFQIKKPGGELVPCEYSARFLNIQQHHFIQAVIRDISERLHTEQALRDSEARYKRITEGLTDYQYTVRVENGRAVETIQSPACVTVTGYRSEEFAANPYLWIEMVAREDRELVTERLKHVLAGEEVQPIEHRIIRKDGKLRWVSDTIILFKDASGTLLSYDGVIRDITERKRAETVIQESEATYRSLFENMLNGIAYCQMVFEDGKPTDFVYVHVNPAFLSQTGLKDVVGRRVTEIIPNIRDADPEVFEIYGRVASTGVPQRFEIFLESLQQWHLVSLFSPKSGYFVSVFDVITERKQAEARLQRANRALQTLSAGNLALVRSASEEDLLQKVTRILVVNGGYNMAAVYYSENDPEKSIMPRAWSGIEDSYFAEIHLSWADTGQAQLPIIRAIRSGTTQICHDIVSDPIFQPWRDDVLARGYKANIALPLSGGGGTFGGLSIYSAEADAFDKQEVALLEELANDLAYGITTLRTRAEHEQHARLLRQSLEQSIQTIAGTVEARDPYTAGHQRRVAELATAIAREMGLPEEQINGINLAAMIHDLGKIHIPAEILSKPGEPTDIEYMLIKTHPQAGYDILKDVRFPWPIAQIILQHHERLDGSGYPNGLKGDQILLESRILTVADVVEAMSSHRPYRPTLGAVAALSEIDRGRGSAYDAAAVAACTRLFVDKGFRFSD